MRDSLTSDNARDFNARYVNTIGWLIHPNKGRQIVRLKEGEDNSIRFDGLDGGEYEVYADSNIEFEFIPVKRRFYQVADGRVFLLERVPARQWKRGICSDNTQAWWWKDRWYNAEVTPKIIDMCMHEKEFLTLQDGQLKLNSFFAIMDSAFYWFRTKMGVVNKNIITLDNPVIMQEVQDAIKRGGFEYGVN